MSSSLSLSDRHEEQCRSLLAAVNGGTWESPSDQLPFSRLDFTTLIKVKTIIGELDLMKDVRSGKQHCQ